LHVDSASSGVRLTDFDKELNAWSADILGSALDVHSHLGPGLLEGAYEIFLAHDLSTRGYRVQRQVQLPLTYKGVRIDAGYRVDLLVNDRVIVEVKAVATIAPIHEAQLLSYLVLGNHPLGLLINFHVSRLKDGIRRMVNSSAVST
jgi:GxxExxY protein